MAIPPFIVGDIVEFVAEVAFQGYQGEVIHVDPERQHLTVEVVFGRPIPIDFHYDHAAQCLKLTNPKRELP